jgi:hypothetical protein
VTIAIRAWLHGNRRRRRFSSAIALLLLPWYYLGGAKSHGLTDLMHNV